MEELAGPVRRWPSEAAECVATSACLAGVYDVLDIRLVWNFLGCLMAIKRRHCVARFVTHDRLANWFGQFCKPLCRLCKSRNNYDSIITTEHETVTLVKACVVQPLTTGSHMKTRIARLIRIPDDSPRDLPSDLPQADECRSHGSKMMQASEQASTANHYYVAFPFLCPMPIASNSGVGCTDCVVIVAAADQS